MIVSVFTLKFDPNRLAHILCWAIIVASIKHVSISNVNVCFACERNQFICYDLWKKKHKNYLIWPKEIQIMSLASSNYILIIFKSEIFFYRTEKLDPWLQSSNGREFRTIPENALFNKDNKQFCYSVIWQTFEIWHTMWS